MPDNSELAALFPHLAAQFDNWDGRQPADDGHDDPSHAGVTDDDIEAYLQSVGSLRAPLSPLVSGQQAPPAPEFAGNGRRVPPGGQATVEPAQDVPAEPSGEGTAGAEGEGEPTTTPPPPPPTPDFYEIGGRKYDRSQAEAWAQFDSLLSSDQQLRDLIQSHLRARQGLGNTAPPPAAAPPAEPSLELPALPPEYADDETIKSLYRTVQQQQAALDRVSRQSQQAVETATTHAQRTYIDIAKGAMSEFQAKHQLDDSTMEAVGKAAAATGLAERYMQGYDPIAGVPVEPDPFRAATRALEVGYYMTPETRQLEIQREAERVINQTKADATRKEKLAGVSGAAGSVPRTQNVPTDPQDRHAAMLSEVAQMFGGQWAGDGS